MEDVRRILVAMATSSRTSGGAWQLREIPPPHHSLNNHGLNVANAITRRIQMIGCVVINTETMKAQYLNICDRIWEKGALRAKRDFLSLFNLPPFQASESLALL